MNSSTQRKPLFVSLRVKLLVAFTLLFSLIFAATYYWYYSFATQKAMSRIAEDLSVLLQGSVRQVDGDAFEGLVREGQPREDGYTDDARYWAHVETLHSISEFDPRSILYSFIRGEQPNEVIFIGSGGALMDPPFGAKFRESFIPESGGDIILSGLERQTLLLEPYTDSFGSWVSGYTPIYNAQGESVGGLGIDFRADYVTQIQREILNNIAIALLLTYALMFILVWIISNAFSRPLRRLTHSAERIGEGQYDIQLEGLSFGPFRDELRTLARVFDLMSSKVRTREEKLKQQVSDLQIILDTGKRDKQVSEIVDSDFFQSLQTKAASLRQRRQAPAQQSVESAAENG